MVLAAGEGTVGVLTPSEECPVGKLGLCFILLSLFLLSSFLFFFLQIFAVFVVVTYYFTPHPPKPNSSPRRG